MDDVELRLECLRLASHCANDGEKQLAVAREFYDFVKGLVTLPASSQRMAD